MEFIIYLLRTLRPFSLPCVTELTAWGIEQLSQVVLFFSICGAEQGKGREMRAERRMTVVENQ